MYSGAEKCMLYCVVSKKEIVQVKEIVREVDPDAFVIVSDAREVLGEGFQEHKLLQIHRNTHFDSLDTFPYCLYILILSLPIGHKKSGLSQVRQTAHIFYLIYLLKYI